MEPDPPLDEFPHADAEVQAQAEQLEGELVNERPVAIRALLAGTVLLRIGTVAAGAGVQFFLGAHSQAIWVGFVGASQALAEAFSAPFLARLADRIGRRRLLVAGPLIGGVGSIVLYSATLPHHFALARVLEGVGAGAFIPTALGLIAAASAHNQRVRAKASAAFEGANLLGYALGFTVGGLLWHALHSGAFLVIACFYALAALVCFIFVPLVPAQPVSPLSVVVRAVTRHGPIRSFLPAWMASFAVIGAYLSNGAALLEQRRGQASPTQLLVHHFDERVIGSVLTLWIVILVIGIFFWVPVLTRIGAARTMRRAIPGVWVLSAGMLGLNHTSLSAAVIFLPIISAGVLILAGFGPAAVTYLAECSETFAADRSALMSFYTVTLAVGGAFGALVGGLAAQWFQADGVIGLGIILGVVAYFALMPVVRYERTLVKAIDAEVHT